MAHPPDQVSSTRLYIGNLPRNITKQEIEDHFNSHGTGVIKDLKLMNGFGFIEYGDELDARDVVPAFHGSDLKGERLTVQFAKGPRKRDDYGQQERQAPRPRRTIYRMTITGLAGDTSWQDLKDFARNTAQLDVVYSETSRNDSKGFVEFETSADLKAAVEKLDGREFKGATVHCQADIQDERDIRQFNNNNNYRQRSPMGRGRGYGPPPGQDEYYGRPPPRGYSPRAAYRERSPGRGPPYGREPYYDDRYARRSPPRDYGHPPRRYDDPYAARGPPPPPQRGYEDPYARADPYNRPRSIPPPRGDYGAYNGGGGGGGGGAGAYREGYDRPY